METRGKELASRCFSEDEEFLAKEKIAEWLGGQYVLEILTQAELQLTSRKWPNQQSRSPLLYRLFQFHRLETRSCLQVTDTVFQLLPVITRAHRRLCAKLYLKAETQQVDRILEEFSRRYWDCNPTTVYGSASK